MYSMTGFGHTGKSFSGFEVALDVRTLNGRYLDIKLRLPRELIRLESQLRKAVAKRLKRGRVEISVALTYHSKEQYELNPDLVDNYVEMVRRIRERGVPGELDVGTLLQLPEVVALPEYLSSSSELAEAAHEVLAEALDQVLTFRQAEGERLKKQIESRMATLDAVWQEIEAHFKQDAEHRKVRLEEKLRRWLGDQSVDADRLAQEVVFYVGRSDIEEELTRLRVHLERFQEQLSRSEQSSIGRSLDFLCQELNREMNTILSKAAMASISAAALQGKIEIEKLRELVQNVE